MAYDQSGNWDENGQFDANGNPISSPGGSSQFTEQTGGAALPNPADVGRTAVDNPAATRQNLSPDFAPANLAPGGVAQTQQGYAPVTAPGVLNQDPIATTNFYNGNTGASATYDPSTGMYIDSNGQAIRPDAIRTGGGTTASGGSSSAPAAAASAAAAPAAPDFNAQVRAMLMDQLTKAGEPVDPNSPEIAATMSASSDAGQRASDAERTALAERLYAQGGTNTDAITREIQQSGEKQAATQSTLKAQLLTQQYQNKFNQLQQMMSLAVQAGDAQSAQSIQMQIANLQAAVQREGLGVNLAEFGASLDQNAALAGLRG